MKLKKLLSLLLALALLSGLTACETYDNFKKAFVDPKADKVIKIGVFEPLTGADADAASDEIMGIELAHELYGSVNGVQVELVYTDNQSDVELALSAAEGLAEQDVAVVLGSYKSVLSLAGGDIFEHYRIPAIAATCNNPLITQTNDYYFRSCFVEAYQGVTAAEYIFDGLNRNQVVAFKMQGDDYADTMTDQFIQQFSALTGEEKSVLVVEYPKNGEDYEAYVEKLVAAQRSVVFFPSTGPVAEKIISTAYDMGYRINWVGPSRWSGMENVSENPDKSYLDGVSYITDYDPNAQLSAMTETFNEAWTEKYGADDIPSNNAALGFDAYLLALQAIRIAGNADSGPVLREALLDVANMSGATGMLTIDENGDPTKDVVVVRYTNGAATPVYTVKSIKESGDAEQ